MLWLWKNWLLLLCSVLQEHRSTRTYWLDPWTHRHALRQSLIQQGWYFPHVIPEVRNPQTHTQKAVNPFWCPRSLTVCLLCFCLCLWVFCPISPSVNLCFMLFSLSARFHRGDVLITTATGVMTEEEGERWGLVPTHAYAVLDIREYKVSLK